VSRKTIIHLLITLAAILLYVPFLGSFHLFDWDEINFAEGAREMLTTGDWGRVQIAFEPFWEKPPLFIWMQAISMKLFGINGFAARFPNAVAGIISLNIFYHIGRKHVGHFFGLFFALAYAGSLAPGLYFKTGIIDPVFNLFIFLAVYQWFMSELEIMNSNNARIHYLLFGVFAGLAVLTKGPVALLIVGILAVIRLVQNGKNAWPGQLNLLVAFFAFSFTVGLWLGIETYHRGTWFLAEFFRYQIVLLQGQIEWHNQPWYYHLVVLFFLCTPAVIFAFPYLFRNPERATGNSALLFSYMRGLFWTVLIIFSIVTTKIIHYSSLCWIPLAFMAAYGLYGAFTNRISISRWLSIPLLLSLLPLAVFFAVAPYLLTAENRDVLLAPLLKNDLFALRLLTKGDLWSGFEGIPALLFLIFAVVWIFRFAMGWTKQAAPLFIAVLLFAQCIYIFILPKAEKQLQGEVIGAIERESIENQLFEAWHYKTYAILFYGKMSPEAMKGPWSEGAKQAFPNETAPNYTARKHWLMAKPTTLPVKIITRCDYKGDADFYQSFRKIAEPGPYIIWERLKP
jgi:4-amino-4-deoxy-L-arabinose transferase-like glycosyltransferase